MRPGIRLGLLVSLLCFATGALAGEPRRSVSSFHPGLRAGVSFSQEWLENRPNPEITYGHRAAAHVSGTVSLQVRPALWLEGGLGLSMKGLTAKQEELIPNPEDPGGPPARAAYEETFQREYLTVPALVRFVVPAGRWSPFLRGGLEAAYLLRARDHARIRILNRTHAVQTDDTNRTARWDLGLVGGAGLEFPLGEGTGTAEAAYVRGLRNTNGSENRGEQRVENRVLELSLGYRF